ncbi:M48 family metallopeptidase [Marinihelvus fidelis]|uniref:M48 family metallopeptidase n=1 Tax=Marinihelvus fidelis TaxID=2613842 RepID=UPI00177F5298|nr:SprT family zinc-dependent metalloprotease [Marinihelvus fidelis]
MNELPFSYRVERRKRVTRRLHLALDDDGELLAVVPRHVGDAAVHRLLVKNVATVERYLRRAQARRPPPLEWHDGSMHLFTGRTLPLQLRAQRGRARETEFTDQHIAVYSHQLDEDSVRRTLRAGYLAQARRLFAQRVDTIRAGADWTRGLKIELKLQRMKRTWGTCSSKGVIRLNTHLVKAPPQCLDYVIAHELCHLQVMNHGPEFYRLQDALYPGWQDVRTHLREHGRRYTRD